MFFFHTPLSNMQIPLSLSLFPLTPTLALKTLSPQPGPGLVRGIGMYTRLMKITSRAFISSNTTERRVCTQEIFDLN